MTARFRLVALRDIALALSWYGPESASAKKRFASALVVAVAIASEFPEAFQEAEPGVKYVLIKGYPYRAYYSVEESEIVILRVYHTSRRPPDAGL